MGTILIIRIFYISQIKFVYVFVSGSEVKPRGLGQKHYIVNLFLSRRTKLFSGL